MIDEYSQTPYRVRSLLATANAEAFLMSDGTVDLVTDEEFDLVDLEALYAQLPGMVA